MIEYGKPPVDLGEFRPDHDEMMFYLYLPIQLPDRLFHLPERLKPLGYMANRALYKAIETADWDVLTEAYVYLTAKTLHVTKSSPGNRPGWHCDGFGSNGDLNFIWSDKNPSEFAIQDGLNISSDDQQSMIDMEEQIRPESIITYPNNHLLMLDEGVIHRVGPVIEEGVRRFIKITISRHRFCNKGNSRNHLIPETRDWCFQERSETRNLDHAQSNKTDIFQTVEKVR